MNDEEETVVDDEEPDDVVVPFADFSEGAAGDVYLIDSP